METYGDKARKYEARIRKASELGLETRKKDPDKLYCYLGRAEKKGYNHKSKLKDDLRTVRKKGPKIVGKVLKSLFVVGHDWLLAPVPAEPWRCPVRRAASDGMQSGQETPRRRVVLSKGKGGKR